MSVWFCYVHLVLLDLWRLRSLVLPQIFVVAGICLPILLLVGLKRGHIEELRKDLVSSPTGRQVRFWTTQEGELLTPRVLRDIAESMPGVEQVIPDAHHIGQLTSLQDEKRRVPDVTFETTRKGDPILGLAGCDVLDDGELAVVLSRQLADDLNAGVGSKVRLDVTRQGGEKVSLDLAVKAIDGRGAGRKIAQLDAAVQDRIELFLRGNAVQEYRWAGTAESASDTYVAYLLFCRAGDDLTAKDQVFYEQSRNFRLTRVEDEARRTLYGLLKPHDLIVYALTKDPGKGGVPRRVRDRPEELMDATEADEVIVPWCPPQERNLGDKPYRLVGFSVPRARTWLKSHLRVAEVAFGYDAPEFSVAVGEHTGASVSLALGREAAALRVVGLARQLTDVQGRVPVAVVPVQLMAHLDMTEQGLVQFDPTGPRFVPAPEEISYIRARLFTNSIDDVPAVVSALAERKLAYESQTTRIREIQKQDASLEFIVFAVGVGVLVFGVFTVANVLVDSTARKRGTLGILRVMGVSRAGVFFLVFLRAALIGVVAGGLATVAGVLLGWALRAIPVLITFRALDLLVVFLSAVLCCVVGSLYPAWTASCVDPYETIIEGKFR